MKKETKEARTTLVRSRHGTANGFREPEYVPHGPFFAPGKFGRMFPFLPALETSNEALIELGVAMIEPERKGDPGLGDNKEIAAGFTYLGQFVDHDITFDTTPLPERRVDPQRVHNFRTPKLDLDSLYGAGPLAQPYLYKRPDGDTDEQKLFLIGQTAESPDGNGVKIPSLPNDLPRNDDGFALIGDPRNDENLIVAQLHLAMLKFHNKVAAELDFDDARRTVTWHYQWIVLHDFVAKLVDKGVLKQVLENGRRDYQFEKEPFIPVEFSVAAYRLGHSMVRDSYDHNRVFGPPGTPPRLAEGSLDLLFRFTGLSGNGKSVPVPSNWIIDWRRFFPLGSVPGGTFNFSRRLDPFLAPTLGRLPLGEKEEKRLAVRNLLRGKQMGLPSGQCVARALHLDRQMLTPEEIESGPDGAVARKHGLHRRTPLWYYILKEASIKGDGRRLGPVGSRILAEVFVGLLEGDSNSFLAQDPDWTPELPSEKKGAFTMQDLLRFVDDINPIGD